MDKLKRSVLQAEEDLQSTQPPIRARGMVSLGRLARGFTGIIPKEKIPLVTEFEESSESEEDPTPFLIQEVLRLSMAALSDSESYVYLAVGSNVKTVILVHPSFSLICFYRPCKQLLLWVISNQKMFCPSLHPLLLLVCWNLEQTRLHFQKSSFQMSSALNWRKL